MGREYSWEIRERAEELYIVDGHTYELVAETTGVSLSQLKRWGGEGDWSGRKREYRQALASVRRDTVLLKGKLLKQAMNSLDPQQVYAFSRLQSVTDKIAAHAGHGTVIGPAGARSIKTPEDAVQALQEAVETRVNSMLAGGEVSLKGIREMKEVLELLEKMRSELQVDDTSGRRELDPATIRKIRDIYGLQ